MSERGSFVTQYVHCSKCFEAAKAVLLGRDKWLCSTVIPSWVEGEEIPVIAGKIGGIGRFEEIRDFMETARKMENCHEVRVAIFDDDGEPRTMRVLAKRAAAQESP